MTMYVNTENKGTLNLRSSASKSGIVLMQIPYHAAVTIESTGDEWSKITYKNTTGYVMTKFLASSIDDNSSKISKSDLKKVYDDLSKALKTIEEILK